MGHGRSMMSDTRAVTYCFIINISSSIRLFSFHFMGWSRIAQKNGVCAVRGAKAAVNAGSQF
jgi:hypothetical protein